jgi:hypothetical protein
MLQDDPTKDNSYLAELDDLQTAICKSTTRIKTYSTFPKHESLPKFLSVPETKEINTNIYLHEDFMFKTYEDYSNFALLNTPKESWQWGHYRSSDKDDYPRNATSEEVGKQLGNIVHSLSNYFIPEYNIVYYPEFSRTVSGENNKADLNNIKNTDSIDYGIVYFLGDFKGGELYFPEIDFTYQPKSNDLLIFSKDQLPKFAPMSKYK